VVTPQIIANGINAYVKADVADSSVCAPHLTLGGFDEFVEKVVPIQQETDVFRSAQLFAADDTHQRTEISAFYI